MRKFFLFIASALLSVSAMAENFSVDGIYYSTLSENTVQVVAPTLGKYTGAIVIPEKVTYNATTYKVTAIGNDAFKGATQTTSVTLPITSITSIGSYAFNDCTGLTEFTLPATITSIGEKAFYYCDNLHNLYMHSTDPASYNAGSNAFSKIHYGSHVCTLHVPTGCTAAYNADPTFSVFTQVAEFDPPQVYNLYVAGTRVTEFNAADILGNGVASYDAAKNTLTLQGDITAPDTKTSCIKSDIDITINVAAPSILSATDKALNLQYATITGASLLTVSISSDEADACAIYAYSLRIENANLSVAGTIWCQYDDMYITNSTVTLTEDYTGIAGAHPLTLYVNNSNVTVPNNGYLSPIFQWGYLVLTDCYLKTPQGGRYNESLYKLVDVNGQVSPSVEIRVGEAPTLYDLFVAGTQVTSLNATDILGNGVASYDAAKKILTLQGDITAPDTKTSCIKSDIDITINVAAPSILSATDKALNLQYATITGASLLTVSISSDEADACAIYAYSLRIENANLSVAGTIWCQYDDMYITNSTVTLTEDYTGIAGAHPLTLYVNNSNVTVPNNGYLSPIFQWGYLVLTDCYLKTPQGGRYNESLYKLVDVNGQVSPSVEIVATGAPTAEIKFVNYDGTELQNSQVEYGATPAYNGATPTKPATAQYTYTFAGWTPTIVSVTGDATYTATYNETVNKYTIKFVNYDGTELQSGLVEYGATPAYNGATPTKPATAQYTYTFAGWTPAIVAVTGDAIYTATYNSTRNSYTVTWKNDDGSTIDQTVVEYGQTPTHADPTKPATAEYTYTFTGWTPNVVAVTGNATYTATYSSTKNSYTVTFVDYDGTELKVETVEYGQAATPPANPVRENYYFMGWDSDFSFVTEDMTVTATYKLYDPTDVDNISTSKPARKVMIDGQIFILRGDKTYTLTGQNVE